MNQHEDLASAVRQRERSRRRMRRVTVAVGAASLATAGVVAYHLPGTAHTAAANGSATTPAPQPSAAANGTATTPAAREPGDDDEGGVITVPGGTANQAPSHATSGGS
jgi:hypothetical protein